MNNIFAITVCKPHTSSFLVPGMVTKRKGDSFCCFQEVIISILEFPLHSLQIFNRFLSGLHLPVGKRKPSYHSSFELLAVSTTARWIVYMINTDNGCLDHLSTLFKALESFYHPSNYGRHSVSTQLFQYFGYGTVECAYGVGSFHRWRPHYCVFVRKRIQSFLHFRYI